MTLHKCHLINPKHPVVQGAKILKEDDVLRGTDLSACVSMLLTLEGEPWIEVGTSAPELIGKTVQYAGSPEYGDMDRNDRIFIRPQT